MVLLRCPTCGRRLDTDDAAAMPFCSERCRLLDLGRWLNEDQGLPVYPDPDDEEEGFEAY